MLPFSTNSQTNRFSSATEFAPEVEYLLVCQANSNSFCDGSWSFAVETASGDSVLQAEDVETGDLNRLTLLAAVRGLESIDGPASVLLLSNNRYLIRSLSDSLPRWRANGFEWEHFGRKMEVQHADLWRRVDHALDIHCVQACLISSRLVSGGSSRLATKESPRAEAEQARSRKRGAWEGTNAWDRIEPAHTTFPKSRGLTSDNDGLRRWLLDDVAKQASPKTKRRFDAADLL